MEFAVIVHVLLGWLAYVSSFPTLFFVFCISSITFFFAIYDIDAIFSVLSAVFAYLCVNILVLLVDCVSESDQCLCEIRHSSTHLIWSVARSTSSAFL